jgi:hypothetical protein
LLLDFRAEEVLTTAENAAGATGMGPGGATARLAPPPPPLLKGGEADGERLGDLGLRLFACFQGGDDALTEVLGVGSHDRQHNRHRPYIHY